MSHASGSSQLFRTRRFAPLFITQFFGAFNDNLLKNTLVILIAYSGVAWMGIPAEQLVPLASGIFVLPYFLFSATAGQIADRFEKTRIVRIIKQVEIGLMVVAAYGFIRHDFNALMLVLFGMGLHSTFFGPIKYSLLPTHLSDSELVGGNALIEMGTFLAILTGSLLGGVFAAERGGPGEWKASIGLLICAGLGYLASRSIPAAPPVDPKLKIDLNPIRPTLSIIRFLKKDRGVYLSVMGISWFWLLGAGILSILPIYCKDVIGTTESGVTLFLTCFSIGIGVGSVLCGKLSKDRLELGLVPLGSIGMTLCLLDLWWVGAFSLKGDGAPVPASELFVHGKSLRVIFDLSVLSVMSGFYNVPLYTLIQERSEKSHQSRVIAANNILNALYMVIGSGMIAYLLKQSVSIPTLFGILGILNAIVAIYIYTVIPEFLFRFIAWMLAHCMYRLKVTGAHQIPKTGAAVLICNHVSFIDWLIISAGIKRPIRYVMDYSFQKNFLVRRFIQRAKVIPIATAKEDPQILQRSFEMIEQELKAGHLVCIFPEGRLSADGKMGPFKKGVERILERSPVPVIPMALIGLWGSIFSRFGGRALGRMPHPKWRKIELRIGSLKPATATAEALQQEVALLLN